MSAKATVRELLAIMSGDGLGARLSVGKSGSSFAEGYARLWGGIMRVAVELRGDPLTRTRLAEEHDWLNDSRPWPGALRSERSP